MLINPTYLGSGIFIPDKYIKNASICNVKHKQTDSPIWSDLLKIRDIYLQGRKMCVRNGKKTLFWKDRWLCKQPLCLLYPDLFKMCQQQDITVAEVRKDPKLITFTRWLVDEWDVSRNKIMVDTAEMSLKQGNDDVSWKFRVNGRFTVKSVYNALTSNEAGIYHKCIWNGKFQKKLRFFSG